MRVTDELVENARRYAEPFDKSDLAIPPAKKVAVVACMDARLIPTRILGLDEGDAHVIRNAGGVITDDEIRSVETFTDVDANVRESIRRITDSPFVPQKNVRGFVFDVQTGSLREVV